MRCGEDTRTDVQVSAGATLDDCDADLFGSGAYEDWSIKSNIAFDDTGVGAMYVEDMFERAGNDNSLLTPRTLVEFEVNGVFMGLAYVWPDERKKSLGLDVNNGDFLIKNKRMGAISPSAQYSSSSSTDFNAANIDLAHALPGGNASWAEGNCQGFEGSHVFTSSESMAGLNVGKPIKPDSVTTLACTFPSYTYSEPNAKSNGSNTERFERLVDPSVCASEHTRTALSHVRYTVQTFERSLYNTSNDAQVSAWMDMMDIASWTTYFIGMEMRFDNDAWEEQYLYYKNGTLGVTPNDPDRAYGAEPRVHKQHRSNSSIPRSPLSVVEMCPEWTLVNDFAAGFNFYFVKMLRARAFREALVERWYLMKIQLGLLGTGDLTDAQAGVVDRMTRFEAKIAVAKRHQQDYNPGYAVGARRYTTPDGNLKSNLTTVSQHDPITALQNQVLQRMSDIEAVLGNASSMETWFETYLHGQCEQTAQEILQLRTQKALAPTSHVYVAGLQQRPGGSVDPNVTVRFGSPDAPPLVAVEVVEATTVTISAAEVLFDVSVKIPREFVDRDTGFSTWGHTISSLMGSLVVTVGAPTDVTGVVSAFGKLLFDYVVTSRGSAAATFSNIVGEDATLFKNYNFYIGKFSELQQGGNCVSDDSTDYLICRVLVNTASATLMWPRSSFAQFTGASVKSEPFPRGNYTIIAGIVSWADIAGSLSASPKRYIYDLATTDTPACPANNSQNGQVWYSSMYQAYAAARDVVVSTMDLSNTKCGVGIPWWSAPQHPTIMAIMTQLAASFGLPAALKEFVTAYFAENAIVAVSTARVVEY